MISTKGPTGNYTFTDVENITLTSNAMAAGWTGSGTTTVTGPDSSVTTIATDTLTGNDTVTVQSTDAPVTVNFTNVAGNLDTVTVGGSSSKGAQGVKASVSVNNSHGMTVLNVDDSADLSGQTATIAGMSITGLAPGAVNYSSAALLALNVKGGIGGNTFTVSGLPDAIVTLNTGAGATLNPNSANPNTVAVQNTSDPASGDTIVVNSQGLDTVDMSAGTSIDVTGTVKLAGVAESLTINTPDPVANVLFTNSSTGSINGAVLLAGALLSSTLTIDDSADTTGRTMLVSNGLISGILPAQVSVPFGDLTSLTFIGAGRLGTLNINANKQGPVSVIPSAGVGSGTITNALPVRVTYENMAAVNVTNSADLPLTMVSDTVTTTTGDLALEGKSATYLVTSFLDSDMNARPANFSATINWGDGSPSGPGSISSDGFVGGQPKFTVSANHNYHNAGTYTASVTLVDLGTGAVPSILGGIPVTITDLGSSPAKISSIAQVNLVSNGIIPAANTDTNLVDAWGIAESSSGPLWVGDSGTGLATVYNGSGVPQTPVVTIPPPSGGSPPSSPSGVAFNPHTGAMSAVFDLVSGDQTTSAVFLFATANGTISGWNPGVSASSAILKVDNSASGALYTGLAVADSGGSTFLYAANFHSGMVEVYDQDFNPVASFTDPGLPAGYAPYNIVNLKGNLYVTFAEQDAAKNGPVAGVGNGFVDIFSPAGCSYSN